MQTAKVYQRKPLPENETQIIAETGTSLKSKILSVFTLIPNLVIAPTEFAHRYQLRNPIHAVRPRFNELEKEGYLRATDQVVKSVFGKSEHRYRYADPTAIQTELF